MCKCACRARFPRLTERGTRSMNRHQLPLCIGTSSAPSSRDAVKRQATHPPATPRPSASPPGPLAGICARSPTHRARPAAPPPPASSLAAAPQGGLPRTELGEARFLHVSRLSIAHHDMTNDCSPCASKYSATSGCAQRCRKGTGKGPRSTSRHASCAALELGARFRCSRGLEPVSIRNVWMPVSLL